MENSAEHTLAVLKKLYPDLSDAKCAELDRWYTRYTALILRIHERIVADPEAHARFDALTEKPSRPSMTGKVDSPGQTKPT